MRVSFFVSARDLARVVYIKMPTAEPLAAALNGTLGIKGGKNIPRRLRSDQGCCWGGILLIFCPWQLFKYLCV